MFQGPGLAELRQRKKELLLESDINRQILNLEFCQLRLKATELRQKFHKAGSIYKWVAPAAGMAFGFFSMRRKLRPSGRNGHGFRKSVYMKMLAPIAFSAVRKAFAYWRQIRKANGAAE